MDTRTEALISEAILGEAAREFAASELGRTVLGIAEQQAQLAKDALAECDPHDTVSIQRLQNEVRLNTRFPEWLGELITKGQQALEVYQHEQKD